MSFIFLPLSSCHPGGGPGIRTYECKPAVLEALCAGGCSGRMYAADLRGALPGRPGQRLW